MMDDDRREEGAQAVFIYHGERILLRSRRGDGGAGGDDGKRVTHDVGEDKGQKAARIGEARQPSAFELGQLCADSIHFVDRRARFEQRVIGRLQICEGEASRRELIAITKSHGEVWVSRSAMARPAARLPPVGVGCPPATNVTPAGVCDGTAGTETTPEVNRSPKISAAGCAIAIPALPPPTTKMRSASAKSPGESERRTAEAGSTH